MAGETQAQQDATNAKFLAGFDEFLKGYSGASTKPKDTTTTSKSLTRLTTASAKALLEAAAKDAQFTGKFSTADIADFIAKFNAEQAKQIEIVVRAASSKIKPGLTAEAAEKELQSIITTEYPSFFKPLSFASDFIWSKVNFKDEK